MTMPPSSASLVAHLVRSSANAAAREESHRAAALFERAAAVHSTEERLLAMGNLPTSHLAHMAGNHPAAKLARLASSHHYDDPSRDASGNVVGPSAGRDDEDGVDDGSSYREGKPETPLDERIYYPRRNDVLLGRGKPFQSHYGNIRLHKLVNENREQYLGASRDEKNSIAKSIVQNIKRGTDGEPSGRFLKRADDGRDFWLECTDVIARQKVGHALRGKPRRGEFSPRKGDVSPQAAIICDDDPRAKKSKVEKVARASGRETTSPKESPTRSATETALRARLGLVDVDGRSPLLSSAPSSAASAAPGASLSDTLVSSLYRQHLGALHYPHHALSLLGPARATLPGGLSSLTSLGLPLADHHLQYLGAPLGPSHLHLAASNPYLLGYHRASAPPLARLAVPHVTAETLQRMSALQLEQLRQQEHLLGAAQRPQQKRPLESPEEEERIDKRLKEDISVAQELIKLSSKN